MKYFLLLLSIKIFSYMSFLWKFWLSYRNTGSSVGRLAGTSPPPSDIFLFRRLVLLSLSSPPEFELPCSFDAVRSMVSSHSAASALLLFSWEARRGRSLLLASLCCCPTFSGQSEPPVRPSSFESLCTGEQGRLSDLAPSGRDREERMQSSIGNNLGSWRGGQNDSGEDG